MVNKKKLTKLHKAKAKSKKHQIRDTVENNSYNHFSQCNLVLQDDSNLLRTRLIKFFHDIFIAIILFFCLAIFGFLIHYKATADIIPCWKEYAIDKVYCVQKVTEDNQHKVVRINY